MIAEDGIRDLWCRAGTIGQRQMLSAIIRLNETQQFGAAARLASRLIRDTRSLAEAWNQRAVAYFQLQRISESLRDCRQVLRFNSFHFAAVIGMGHCYLEMADGAAALECFRWALHVNPNMEDVRAQVDYLQRALEGN
jgi:tetratricopeptide (TPR) repeat protein